MARLHLVIAVAALVAVAFANSETVGFQVVDNVVKPCAKKLEVVASELVTFHYTLGTRRSGDTLIGNNEYKSGQSFYAQDYQTKINYPTALVASGKLTYVDIIIEQSSANSDVYVTSGSIGENHISLLIEAKNTTYLTAKFAFYGL